MSEGIEQFRFQKVDSFIRDKARCIYLEEDDECFFLGEYSPYKGWRHSRTNSIVYNLKKKPGNNGYEYKIKDIKYVASLYHSGFKIDTLKEFTLVPIPPSSAKDSPEYDSRMLDILEHLNRLSGDVLDIRELVIQTTSMTPSHLSSHRATVGELKKQYIIDNDLLLSKPVKNIIVFDDVLTTGTHFKAIQAVLQKRLPTVTILGVFFACSIDS
ncbi:hypothetical protein [Pelistega ratti]|uniref:hypothetical protein n=1 Tax=Pelistega ratti TaxID=2652177 RepID=UPI001358DDB5|nr:hypothetical protein [Pelistega ratti]